MTKAEKEKRKAERDAKDRQNEAVVDTGKCPNCMAPLVANIVLDGNAWWQCAAYPDPQYRELQHADLPSCTFQVFVPLRWQ